MKDREKREREMETERDRETDREREERSREGRNGEAVGALEGEERELREVWGRSSVGLSESKRKDTSSSTTWRMEGGGRRLLL